MKVPVTLLLDVDVAGWNREYNGTDKSETSAADIRWMLRDDVEDIVRNGLQHLVPHAIRKVELTYR